jgi:hypothetical protein
MGVERNHFVKKTKIQTGTTLILISIYEVSGEGFIGERESYPLIGRFLLVGLLLDNDESRCLTNLWGHQTDKDDLLVSF